MNYLEKLFDTPAANEEVYQAVVDAVKDLKERDKEVNYHACLKLPTKGFIGSELPFRKSFEKPLK